MRIADVGLLLLCIILTVIAYNLVAINNTLTKNQDRTEAMVKAILAVPGHSTAERP